MNWATGILEAFKVFSGAVTIVSSHIWQIKFLDAFTLEYLNNLGQPGRDGTVSFFNLRACGQNAKVFS